MQYRKKNEQNKYYMDRILMLQHNEYGANFDTDTICAEYIKYEEKIRQNTYKMS